jgi:hypothetical protein
MLKYPLGRGVLCSLHDRPARRPIIITGTKGFIGSNLKKELEDK